MEASEKFESWGVLELFGHLKLAGKITEQTIGGCAFIRIDVPAIGDAQPFTRYFTNGAIYSMTPTSERVAIAVATNLRAAPVSRYDIQLPAALPHQPRDPAVDDNDDDDQLF